MSRIRKMAHKVARAFVAERKKLGFPLLQHQTEVE